MSATNKAVLAVPMSVQHARDVFACRRDPRNTKDMTDAQFTEMVGLYQRNGSAWAVVAHDITIAIGGVYVLRAHVGEAWLVPTAHVERYPVAFSKIAKMVVNDARTRFKLHRIQMAARKDDERARQFVEWLGCRDEGVMRKYGSDGSDYVRFAYV